MVTKDKDKEPEPGHQPPGHQPPSHEPRSEQPPGAPSGPPPSGPPPGDVKQAIKALFDELHTAAVWNREVYNEGIVAATAIAHKHLDSFA